MRLVISALAGEHIRDASEWWFANRPAARGLFKAELRQALDLIQRFPQSGAVTGSTELADIRRVLLRRTRYRLYYRIGADAIDVLAIWHTSREGDPDLA